LNYYFARVLSQLSYNGGDTLENQWRAGAGFVYGYTADAEQAYFMNKLNFSEKDYNYLRGMVRLQNGLANGITAEVVKAKWEDFEVAYIANYKRCNSLPANYNVTLDEYLAWYKSQWMRYYGKGDFAHMMYTISATLVDPKAEGVEEKYHFWRNSKTRIDITGWLGDATVSKPFEPKKLGPDDYIADLDAVNIMAIASKNPDESLVQLFNNYYTAGGIGADGGRAEAFLENVGGYQYVWNEIFASAGMPQVDALRSGTWQDSYNFLQNLKAGNDIMKDYTNNK
jgi:hypothetical protein